VRQASRRGGGYTTARTWSIELADGRRVFAKFAVDDETAPGNQTEAVVLDGVDSPHLPVLVGIADDGSVLVTEDLAASNWDPHLGALAGLWMATADRIGAQFTSSSV
jgi:hypothetical protein